MAPAPSHASRESAPLDTELRPWHTAVLGVSVLMLVVTVAVVIATSTGARPDTSWAAQQPVPESVVQQANGSLDKGDTWRLVLDGRPIYCGTGAPDLEQQGTFLWLRFRLAPAVPACDDIDVTIENRDGTWEVRS
jgi:hypothetical protein